MLSAPDFAAGLWIRTIRDLPRELRILIKRNEYTDAEWRLSHTPAAERDPLFTPYSPAHFMVEGIPAKIAFDDTAGIIFRHEYRPVLFYDGCGGERLTGMGGRTDMDYSKAELDNGKHPRHQLRFPSSGAMRDLLLTRYKEDAADDAYYARHPDEIPCLDWNEGLLRYGFKDIRGIYVDLESPKACKEAFSIREKLGEVGKVGFDHLRFYQFKDGEFIYTRTHKVDAVASLVRASTGWASAATPLRDLGHHGASSAAPMDAGRSSGGRSR